MPFPMSPTEQSAKVELVQTCMDPTGKSSDWMRRARHVWIRRGVFRHVRLTGELTFRNCVLRAANYKYSKEASQIANSTYPQ